MPYIVKNVALLRKPISLHNLFDMHAMSVLIGAKYYGAKLVRIVSWGITVLTAAGFIANRVNVF